MTDQSIGCPRCGHANIERARFCANCGLRLEHVAGESSGRSRPRRRGSKGWIILLLVVLALIVLLLNAGTSRRRHHHARGGWPAPHASVLAVRAITHSP